MMYFNHVKKTITKLANLICFTAETKELIKEEQLMKVFIQSKN